MSTSKASLNYAIPSNKFYPPHIHETQSLFRTNLISHKLPAKNAGAKVLIIEAQAGQGKTTLAYQYITHHNYPHIWYQIGKEDSDPVLLLSALLSSFMKKLPDFQSPQLSNILNEGEIGPLDLTRCANILLNDLDQYLTQDLYLIFDDLHIIEEATLANNFIAYLLDTSPPRLHFILTSRHPLSLKCKTLRSRTGKSYLTTEDLALNSREIESLFNDIFNWSINLGEAEKIQKITNGWVMGIVLAAHPKLGKSHLGKGQNKLDTISTPLTHGDMLEYFQDEIFTHLPQSLHIPFLQLSFLDEIQVELAALITGVTDIGTMLSDLAHDNLFIYRLDDNQQVFRFHHLYQEFLQQRAKKELASTDIDTVYETAATFYLERHMLVKALSCFRQGKNFAMMDRILQREGLGLLAQNRTVTLLTLLRSIPEETLIKHGWLTLFAGVLAMDFSPEKTLPLFESAMTNFIAKGEEIGELTAIAQIIYFHFVISGRYIPGAALLPRAEELFTKNNDSLPVHAKIWLSRNIAAGFCFFSSQMDKSREYIHIAKDLATQNNIRNFIASTRFIQGYIELLSGNRASYHQEAEISYSFLDDPLVGMSNKLTLRVMHLCDLSMHGDFLNFFHQQHLLQKSIDKKIITQTIAAPYLYVWGCSCLVSAGKIEQGRELINQGFETSSTARTEHMQSQLLQWQAYTSAILGDTATASKAIDDSLQLRSIAGGPFHQAFCHTIAGAVYTRLKETQKADDNLREGIHLAETIPSPYLLACGLLHLSYSQIISEDTEEALINLEKGLRIMRENSYSHFWSWEPSTMSQLLVTAVSHGIEKDFCKQLATERLHANIDDKGNLVPLLHFTLLDEFSVRLNNEIILHVDDFTPFQREILGLLLIAKGNRLSQDKIQLNLWPDSPPDKARKKFDTLLGRLRKSFSDRLTLPIKNYIVMQKGILSLKNIQTDIQHFTEMGTRALVHSKRDELWQAGNAFNAALSLWKGNLPTNIFISDPVFSYENSLLNTFTQISMSWGEILANTGQLDEAISVVENLLHTNGLEENAISFLCRLHSRANQPLKIRATLNRYRKALQQIEYSNEEIEEMIDNITTSMEE